MFNAASYDSDPASELIGLWKATRYLGPDIRGTLTLTHSNGDWTADIAGYSTDVQINKSEITFKLSGNRGEFRGRIDSGDSQITGHWIQPELIFLRNRYATPVYLLQDGPNRWRGEVIPLENKVTFYLVIEANEEGSVSAFIRNPQFNLGRFMTVNNVMCDDNKVRFEGNYIFMEDEQTIAEGDYRPDNGLLSLFFPFPNPSGVYNFVRIDDDGASFFYPRGKNPAPYIYNQPRTEDDGWKTAPLEDVGIAPEPITDFIQSIINSRTDSVGSMYIHSILIARHGKLVLEEYFHGYHREMPHETRSAGKSMASTLTGIMIQEGALESASSPLYEIMYGGEFPADIGPYKRKITVEHLMTMSAGFDCDDTDFASPGNEDRIQSQTEEPDWHKYSLNLPMVGEPGERSVYCSANSNLLGAVISKVSGKWLPEYFHDHYAKPMQTRFYHINLMPNGEAYMGGGIRLTPRDFLKMGQLLLNGGTWNGKRLLTEDFVQRGTSPLYDSRGIQYGYTWWVMTFPYKGRTVSAFYAGGNGGQYVFVIPELDLAVTFTGGNYNDRVPIYTARDDYMPNSILPAVK
jgi:CubicO group peptidase (beta-lactamase class C family)